MARALRASRCALVFVALAVAVHAGAVAARAGEPATRLVWNAPGANVLGAPTPDGRLVTCVDPTSGDLAVLETATGKLRRLTARPPDAVKEFAYFSVPSRDGSRAAYAWFNEAGFYDLRVVPITPVSPFPGAPSAALPAAPMAPSGATPPATLAAAPAAGPSAEPRILFRNEEAGFVQPTSWTPDGKRILTLFFRKDNISQIALVDAATGEVRVLKSLNWVYPKRMEISPDGKWIAYDSFGGDKPGPRDIYVLAMDGSRESKVVEAPGEDLFPSWSPDGRQLVFASDRGGTMDAWAQRIEDGRAAGEPKLVKRDLKQFLPMGITAAGDLYYGLRTGSTNIALVQSTGELHELPTRTPGRNSAPAWSRDGKKLAYLSRRGAENFGLQARTIVVHDMESGVERDVPAKLAHVESLRWSPDGEWLLASGSDGKGRSGLFRVRVSDGMVRPEAFDETADYRGIPGDWMPDGTVVRGTAGVKALAVSHDGELVARAYDDRVEYGTSKWPFRGVTWLEWPGVILLGTQGGKAVCIPNSKGCPPPVGIQYDGGPFSVRPDRKTIAYTAGGTRSEIWVLEHAVAPLDQGR